MGKTNNFGESLRALRNERKMTKTALAANASISVCEIADLENGVRMPRATTIKKLAEALNVTPESLILELQKDIEND